MKKIFSFISGLSSLRLVVLYLAVAGLFWWNQYSDLPDYDAELTKLQTEIKAENTRKVETDKILKQENDIRKKLTDTSQKYQSISSRLPKELKATDTVRSIQALAKSANVKVKLIQPAQVVPGEIYDEAKIQIQVEGSFSDITLLVYYLSTLERLHVVKAFSYTPEKDGSTKLTLDGFVSTYKLAATPASAGATAELNSGGPK